MERDAAPVPAERLAKRTVLSSAQVQDAWTTLGISDPGIRRQWHIYNNNTPAADINVTSAWVSGITGTDSIVCIIDDGLDSTNPDLKDNFYVEGSWDFNTPSQAPLPQPQSAEDNHGTRCAGEVAAVRNDVCGVGVAYDARVSGVRILSGPLTNADEAAATNYEYQKNQIYSCSWGPPDDGESLDRPTSLSQRSYIEAVTNGRGGKGNIYVFAAGNGGEKFDHCNFDGFVNQIYTIAIASVDYMNRHPSYSEACTAVHAVAPSSPSPQSGPSIYTSDAMPSQCTGQHTGTSASAPLVAGIMALALQANPDLTWRDAQYLIAETSVPVNTADGSWDTLASGKRYSPKYGFGRVDAFAMVDTARNWKNVPAQTSIPYIGQQVGKRIPHGATGVSETITITPGAVAAARLGTVEHVLVYVTVTHPTRGQLSYEIVSPSGIRSIIGEARPYDVSSQGLSNWTFMSLKYWGDQAAGDWTFTIRDEIDESRTGELVSWGLKIYGAQGEGVVSSASTRTAATSSGSLSRTTTKRGTVIVTSVSSSAAATTKSTTRSTTRSRTTTTTTTTEASLTPTLAETSTTTSRTTRTINVTSPIVPTTASPSPTSNRPSSSSGSRAGVGGVLLAAGAAALALGL
ncbi:peptidase S8/S53 domain-containing protein [Hyaloraphidium curvatum]|nr:peptidase S8/S53 domain-containing protein [Hyaloraphidium curvatum]